MKFERVEVPEEDDGRFGARVGVGDGASARNGNGRA